MSTTAKTRIVGASVSRKEGADKLLGRARYVDDIVREGMLYGATVRSTIPRGLIRSIEFDRRIDWSEFTVVTAADIPGDNHIQLIVADQPCLADGQVNHCDEAILLLAHTDKHKLREAVDAVRIEYDLLPPIFTIEESERQDQVVWGSDNLLKSFLLEKGDVDSVWESAAHIVEGEYRTGAQEHLYIENNGIIAEWSAENGVSVWGSLQCPYYVHKTLIKVFDLPDNKVRVVQAETGGAFGGKEDYPSTLASHAALLAMKSGHPVKMVYDRMEDLAATTKRHPSRTRHRTALDKDGKLLAMDIDLATDGGAYSTLSSTVLSRATLHAPGPYSCPNVRVTAKAWATNNVPYGAFRGFGAPQTIFALERHMDEVAAALGMEPVEFRRRNFLHQGDTTATNQLMREPLMMDELLDRALKASDYYAKRARFAAENPNSMVKRGMGIAAFYHGSGFTGSGERILNSLAGVEVTADGVVQVLVSNTEFGQGTNTVLTQIAVDTVTYSVEVEEFWAVQEVGGVLNPVLATGQIEGGGAQGIGYGLYEKVVLKDGHMANNQMTNYIIPTAEDVPPIHVYFEEIPFSHGGYGAKGIGELPHDGPAPAIVNAIKDATGISFHAIPLLPEDLFAGLAAHQQVEEQATL